MIHIEETTRYATALLERLIAVPRVSRSETEAADLLAAEMTTCGIAYQREANNLWCLCPDFDEARPTLLLNAHIDTVKPVASWTRDPYQPQREGDRLYGLGSNDCGGGLVSLWSIFRHFIGVSRSYNLIFLASAEEEVSGANGISRALPLLPKIDVALVGEPTGMQPAIAEKGLMVLDLTAHGKSGHAARGEGVNALYKMLDDLLWIRDYRFRRVSDFLGPTLMTATVVNAGTQHNVVPDVCTAIVDVRTNELYTNQEVYEWVCQHVTSDCKARSFRLGSSHIERQHPIVKKLDEMGKKPFGSPTLSDQALMSFPSLKLGPGESSRSHSADEYICVSEIAGAIADYATLLTDLVI